MAAQSLLGYGVVLVVSLVEQVVQISGNEAAALFTTYTIAMVRAFNSNIIPCNIQGLLRWNNSWGNGERTSKPLGFAITYGVIASLLQYRTARLQRLWPPVG